METQNDEGGFLWGLLGFLVPVAGLILYLVWKDEKPKTAKAVGKGAIANVVVSFAVPVVLWLFLAILMCSYF